MADELNYPDELADLMVGMREIAKAETGYVEAHNYFTGDVPEYFASEKLAARVAKTGSKFRINVARKSVTAVTDRLEISSVVVAGTGDGRSNEALTRTLQQDVWDANELGLEFPEWLERLGELGDVYGFVWPGDEPGTVDIHFSGPRSCRAVYDAENPRRIKYVIKAWTEGAGARRFHRANLYYFGTKDESGRVEKWATIENVSGVEPEHWRPWTGKDGEDEAVVDNPYGQIVWHFRTGRPYGRPLHREAYGPQDAINKLVVSLMNAVDFHLLPQRAALSEGDIESDDDDFDDFATEEDAAADAVLPDPDRRDSRLKSGPGELWLLRNVKALVQLPPADPGNFLNPAEFFMRMMAQVTDQPLHLFDPGGDQPSGDSRRQAENTLTKKVGRVREAVELTAGGLLGKALEILGHPNVKVQVRWSPAAQVDDREGWQTAAAKIEAGVPVAQVLQEMGYESEQVAGWLENNNEQDLRRRIELLGKLATAARDLGTAASLGVLDPALVQEIVQQITGPAEESSAELPVGS